MILNPNAHHMWKKTDHPWFYSASLDQILCGEIMDLNKDTNQVYIYSTRFNTQHIKTCEELFHDYKTANDAYQTVLKKKAQLYADSIKTINDLVYFALTHNLTTGCYPNNTPERIAFTQKTKELLNIDLAPDLKFH